MLDRRSGQSFWGLENSRKVPAAKTIWRWRARLKTHHLMESISAAVNDQLEKAGVMARDGQIIAANIVKAPIQRTTRDDNAPIKTGDTVTQWSDAQQDVQARWTCKHGKTWCGYPLHRRAEWRWGSIRRYSVSAAHVQVHNGQQVEALWNPSNTGRSVWADRASANRQRDADLKQHGDRAWIVEKAGAGKPLRSATQRRNRRLARERASVEDVFARPAHCGGKWVRGIGVARANVVIG